MLAEGIAASLESIMCCQGMLLSTCLSTPVAEGPSVMAELARASKQASKQVWFERRGYVASPFLELLVPLALYDGVFAAMEAAREEKGGSRFEFAHQQLQLRGAVDGVVGLADQVDKRNTSGRTKK